MKLKTLLIIFLLSLPFWWGINVFEKNLSEFLFLRELSKNSQLFTAQIALEEKLRNLKPIKKEGAENLEIKSKSAISVLINNGNEEKILFGKEINNKLPIASLTKLMTALIVLENYDLSKEIKVSKEAIEQEENFGQLKTGDLFSTEYLLYPLLMESSNDAAFSLANDYEGMTEEKFVELMNLRAADLNLENTYFFNPSGLEPEGDDYKNNINYSTVSDLTKFTQELIKEPLIWEILSTPEFTLYGPVLKNTNELLWDSVSWQNDIIGGKTGYTDEAGGCMLLVLEAPKNKGYLINVILGANGTNDRFKEMKNLIDWINNSYLW